MRQYRLDLPHQEFITPNSRAFWAYRHKCAKSWRYATMMVARAEKIPTLDRVTITLHACPPDRRRRDVDGLALVAKWCVDGLRDARVIPEDDSRHVVSTTLELGKPNRSKRWSWTLIIRELPTVAGMGGSFSGPDSVEWLRDQRGGDDAA